MFINIIEIGKIDSFLYNVVEKLLIFLLNQISLYLGENSIKEFLQEIKNIRHENDEIQLFNELINDINIQ